MRMKRRELKKGRLEIVPMIDTFLILLIFYMSFSTFQQIEIDSRVKVPVAPESKMLDKTDSDLVANIIAPNVIMINKVKYDYDSVVMHMRDLVKNKSDHKVIIMIRANKDLSYKEINKFLFSCAKGGIIDIKFVTTQS